MTDQPVETILYHARYVSTADIKPGCSTIDIEKVQTFKTELSAVNFAYKQINSGVWLDCVEIEVEKKRDYLGKITTTRSHYDVTPAGVSKWSDSKRKRELKQHIPQATFT